MASFGQAESKVQKVLSTAAGSTVPVEVLALMHGSLYYILALLAPCL
jgi:hypothetical protein